MATRRLSGMTTSSSVPDNGGDHSGGGGSGGGSAGNWIEDKFSTYLYTGTGADQDIVNGIQLTDGDTNATEYTAPGTYKWTCPAGVTSVCVVCVGAGGNASAGASGGGGELRYKNNIPVIAGTNYTVVVGATVSASGSPTPAESSSFGTTICVANGGYSAWSGGTIQDGGSGGTGDGGGN